MFEGLCVHVCVCRGGVRGEGRGEWCGLCAHVWGAVEGVGICM